MVTTVYHVKKCLDASLRPYATHSRRRCSPRPTSHWIILDRSRRVAPDCHARPRCLRHMPGWRASRSEPGEVARAVSTRASRRGCGSAWLGDTQYSNCQYLYVMMHTYLSMEAGVFSVQGRRPIAQQRALQSSALHRNQVGIIGRPRKIVPSSMEGAQEAMASSGTSCGPLLICDRYTISGARATRFDLRPEVGAAYQSITIPRLARRWRAVGSKLK